MPIIVPENFNGALFMKKFGVAPEDFYIYKGELFCETLPELTEEDVADCVDFSDNSESAILAYIQKWGGLETYPYGNDAQQEIYNICEDMELNGVLTRPRKRVVGVATFIIK